MESKNIFALDEFDIEKFNAQERTSMFIQASAGTGKTYTIKKIVRKLVESKIPLEKILIVTYTEKAVGELKYRIRNELADLKNVAFDADNAPIFTIHSFCQNTLAEFAFTANQPDTLSLAGDSEIEDFLDRWIRDTLAQNEQFRKLYCASEKKSSFINNLKTYLSAAIKKYYLDKNGNECTSIISLDDDFDGNDEEKLFHDSLPFLYLAWQNEKRNQKIQTFDDMLRNVRESVCEKNSLLKEKLREKYTYAVIDEFQDTNQIQWDIFSSVFLEKPNAVIVVGDPKQSIYSFQGADVNVYRKAVEQIGSVGKGFSLKRNRRSEKEMILACNEIFKNKTDDSQNKVSFFDPDSRIFFDDADYWDEIKTAEYDEKKVEPFWIAGNQKSGVNAESFAEIAVSKIVDCCTYENQKTRLQVYDRERKVLRNVNFNDFAVLARTRTEMDEIEAAMRKSGIPFVRYKDANLFDGMECAHWISLLNAVGAEDFNGYNRRLLSEVLFSSFFGIPLEEVQDEKYDSPLCDERKKILVWQQIAKKREWAQFLESVFELSNVEKNFSSLSKMQSLSKMHQIGSYVCEYLYKNVCSLEEAAKHLSRLSKKSENVSDDGSIVAKATDFHCVQVMTIHSSKGLEFPVVISIGGAKGKNKTVPHVYSYHDEKFNARLSFVEKIKSKDSFAKAASKKEQDFEFQRLFYVAFTRASSLMILPYYEDDKKEFAFLKNNLRAFMENPQNKKYYIQIKSEESENSFDFEKLKNSVQKILRQQNSSENIQLKNTEKKNPQNSDKDDCLKTEGEAEQIAALSDFAKKIPGYVLYKHSYVSLTHGSEKSEMTDGENSPLDSENLFLEQDSVSFYDRTENPVKVEYDKNLVPDFFAVNYPKGTKIGIALHEIFEKADFCKIGKIESEETAYSDSSVNELVKNCLAHESFSIDEEDSKQWKKQTINFLWNVLNAKLPEIAGGIQTGNYFCLNEVSERIAEAEFNMSVLEKKVFKNYCNGFIDLIFKREIDGRDVYSVLDWKSDTFSAFDYADEEALKNHTDDKYSIQRVLYSYCLVRWLKFFDSYKNMSYEEIFKNHFGGIYYVYIKGCRKNSSNGIYAKTWHSWQELETQFKKICRELMNADVA